MGKGRLLRQNCDTPARVHTSPLSRSSSDISAPSSSVMRPVIEQQGPSSRRSFKSASIGPPLQFDVTIDVENQTVAKTGGAAGGGAAGASVAASVLHAEETVSLDPGVDQIETRISVLTFLKFVTACSALYMATNPWFFFWDPEKKEICPYSVLCATSPVELTLLTGSRISAGILFASLTISILSKCYATRSFLHHSWLGAVLDFEPTHDVHTYFGYLSLVAAWEHAILHCARFTWAKEAFLIYETDTGRSGLVACLLLLPIVLPMRFDFFKKRMDFQSRKNLHMIFLMLLVAMCFHSVHFRYVGSILIVWYILDRLYFTTKQTFLITHPVFEAVGRGTMVALDLPEGYTFKAGSYIYVNSPTISRSEWHPFSIIQVPGRVPRAAFYAEAVGDWTQELFRVGLQQPRLPLWITAAQPSLMEKSIYYDNIVLVCTGAGITPAVSIIERFANRKNIHLLWMSRDGGMVALFEKQLRKVTSTVHVTGKPDGETKDALQRLLDPAANLADVWSSKRSLRSIMRNDSFRSRMSSLPRAESSGDSNVDDESKTNKAPSDTEGDGLDSLPTRQLKLGPATDMSFESAQSLRRSHTQASKMANPVTLSFGRPDIGKYLTETFAKESDGDEGGKDKLGPMLDMSTSVAYSRHGARRNMPNQRSGRLNSDQKMVKKTLMKADQKTIQAVRSKGASIPEDAVTDDDCGCTINPLPWLVLYCGANPKVEEAIAETCDKHCVKWQKEYFGAW